MARIRTIKPELPHSETLGKVSRDARLLFVNLFTIADDDGRARASSRLLASLLYPYDDDAPDLIDGWLEELAAIGAIRLYQSGDTTYLDIPKWLEHQKIDRPSKSRIPAYSPQPREASRKSDALPSTLDLVPSTKPPKSPKGDTYPEKFLELRKAYPSRGKSADPNKTAFAAWERAIKRGADPDELIRLAPTCAPAEKYGTELVPQMATWLNQERYKDQPKPAPSVEQADPEETLWRARALPWRAGKYWNKDQWGPPPNEPGTKVPAHILEAWKAACELDTPTFLKRPAA